MWTDLLMKYYLLNLLIITRFIIINVFKEFDISRRYVMHCSFLVKLASWANDRQIRKRAHQFLKVPISSVLSEDPLNLAGSRPPFEQMTSKWPANKKERAPIFESAYFQCVIRGSPEPCRFKGVLWANDRQITGKGSTGPVLYVQKPARATSRVT